MLKYYIQKSVKPKKILKDFCHEVIDGLISNKLIELSTKWSAALPSTEIKHTKPNISSQLNSSAHQPERSTRRFCALCSAKDKSIQSDWACSTWNVALCGKK